MYSIAGYGHVIADEGRMRDYSRALQAAICRDSIVLDTGAGTGILSLLACGTAPAKSMLSSRAPRLALPKRQLTQMDLPIASNVSRRSRPRSFFPKGRT